MTIFQPIAFSLNIKRYDICKPFNKKTIYTAIGSRGIIFAKNNVYNHSIKSNVIIYYIHTSILYTQLSITLYYYFISINISINTVLGKFLQAMFFAHYFMSVMYDQLTF